MNMSSFQLVVVSVFVAFIVIGVGAFALFGGVFGGGGTGPVTIWGTMPQEDFDYLLDSLRSGDKSLQEVKYVQQDARTYEATLLNAMASGQAPDLFLATQQQLGQFTDKIIPIPYSTVSQSTYLSSYIDEGNLFLVPQGALALPFSIDPLIMYWNRDLFAQAGISQVPQFWNEFTAQNGLPAKINAFDKSQNLARSTIALGAWQNVNNAKAILSMLFMQAGDFITGRTQDGQLAPTFGTQNAQGSPAESALRFYTEFGNPSKTTYSWNRSLPNSRSAFVGGQLAVYLGFASEYAGLAQANPNLRFGVGVVPQLQAGNALTYGLLTGLTIPRTARNVAGAAVVAQKLTSAAAAGVMIQHSGMPPARRDVTLDTTNSSAAEVFARSALLSRGWVDPNPTATDAVFKTMIESVISGASEPAGAVSEAAQEFQQLIPTHF